MTRDDAEGLGYLCGHAGFGTEDSKMPDINRSAKFRAAYRHGFRLGESDARKSLCQITGIAKGQLHLKPGKGRTVPHWGWLHEPRKKKA